MRLMLDCPLSLEEISYALQELPLDRCTGEDGFSQLLFKTSVASLSYESHFLVESSSSPWSSNPSSTAISNQQIVHKKSKVFHSLKDSKISDEVVANTCTNFRRESAKPAAL